MKILVIGGTGTMGRPLVDKLLAEGNEVYVVCRHDIGDNRTNVHYFIGNAKDVSFMKSKVLLHHFECIVDFCLYSSSEFKARYESLLSATLQYVCLSSAAVYSDIPQPKSEQSPRYMETDPPRINSKYYNWYCYEKARIEDVLTTSQYDNWTIVRPGMTMSRSHFFWGYWFDEEWQFRIANHQKVLVPKDLLGYKASISYGGDVAQLFMSIIGNQTSLKQTYNVTSTEVFTWGDFLDFWIQICQSHGYEIKVKYIDKSSFIYKVIPWKGREYGYQRARLLDRVFDSTKALNMVAGGGTIHINKGMFGPLDFRLS